MSSSSVTQDVYDLVVLVLRRLTHERDLSLAAALTLSTLERRGPMRVTALAGSEGISQPSMTQLLQRLEARGFVSRATDPTDARASVVSLTPDGSRALAERRALSAERVEAMLADLSTAQLDALHSAVADVLPTLRASAEPQPLLT